MKQYKVVTLQDTSFWGGTLDGETFERGLNDAAAEGWELVTTTTVEAEGLFGEHHQLFFVFVRETPGATVTQLR